MRHYYVYILASKSRRLYVGVTNDLQRRLWEHRHGWSEFTAGYHVHDLVYYETLPHPMTAIKREKRIKGFSRADKTGLGESSNPCWVDLAGDWFDPP